MESQKPVTLLFIDDDTSYMAVAQHLLSKHQARRFTILWRQTGSAALELLATNPQLDMLLIDYYLPEMNGLEVVKAIRAKGVDLPIIFLTSNRDFRLAIEAMKYGVEDYLVKDEAVDSVLPRTILNIIERVNLKSRILEQQRADLVARKRADAIKELVVTVCHEFNNPLAAVKISTDILLRQALPDGEARVVRELDKNIGRVEKEINRLRDLNFEAIEPRKPR
jgi:DNA-binding NtrC family response regulator